MIKSMTGGGVTVIMCTHLLLEAEGLAQQVVVLEGGTDLVAGAPRELTRRFWPASVVRIDAEDRSQLARVVDLPGVRGAETVGEGLKELAGMAGDGPDAPLGSGPVDVQLEDPEGVADIVDALVRSGVRLTRVEPRIPTLEDLYFAVRRSRAQSHTVLADDGGRQLTPTTNGAGS
jgi:ABC-type multidrug transport system ATPase subunit